MGSVHVDPITGVMKFVDDDSTVNDNKDQFGSTNIPGQLDHAIDATNEVTVRWHDGYEDGYEETFTDVIEVIFCSEYLYIRYNLDGKIKNRYIPFRSISWIEIDDDTSTS